MELLIRKINKNDLNYFIKIKNIMIFKIFGKLGNDVSI